VGNNCKTSRILRYYSDLQYCLMGFHRSIKKTERIMIQLYIYVSLTVQAVFPSVADKTGVACSLPQLLSGVLWSGLTELDIYDFFNSVGFFFLFAIIELRSPNKSDLVFFCFVDEYLFFIYACTQMYKSLEKKECVHFCLVLPFYLRSISPPVAGLLSHLVC